MKLRDYLNQEQELERLINKRQVKIEFMNSQLKAEITDEIKGRM